ncbi:hypothetical protein Tco_0098323 [Tanacetum coccineum]
MSRIWKKTILQARNNPGHRPGKEPILPKKGRDEENIGEKVTICSKRPDQCITIGSTLSISCKQQLTNVLQKNVDVFAWTGSKGADGLLKPQQNLRQRYVPLSGGGRRTSISDGMPYKCFLRLPKENSQIRMVENDEEKTGFHTEEGKRQNVEFYLEEIVVKSKNEQSLIEDVEETLNKLRRVNVKIDPSESTFGMKEGRFLGYIVTEEGIRPDPTKVQEVMKSHTPIGPDQIRRLSLQLANIGRFIPKLAELMLPIRKVHRNLDATEGPNWTSEAKEAF